ncbi:MAG TPA: DinB family protein [Bacteroidia bacterium]|jgi:hypothetical protein|nr:DinB family protein [Bacteroidia bacterium]
MPTKTSTSPITDLIGQFKLQEKLFTNVASDIKNEDSHKKINQNTNHLAWLIGHTVSTRYMLLNVLGVNISEPFPDHFAQGKGMQENVTYPPVNELIKNWSSVSKELEEKLHSLSESELGANAPFPTPLGPSIKDFISFCSHHEAYTIGQMGLYRRFHGYPAMKYS